MRKWIKEITSPPTTYLDAWKRGAFVTVLMFVGAALAAIGAGLLGVPVLLAGLALTAATISAAARADRSP